MEHQGWKAHCKSFLRQQGAHENSDSSLEALLSLLSLILSSQQGPSDAKDVANMVDSDYFYISPSTSLTHKPSLAAGSEILEIEGNGFRPGNSKAFEENTFTR